MKQVGNNKNSGVNGKIDLSNYNQFELNSKIGNSMKESKMRIHKHMEEINGRRFNPNAGQKKVDELQELLLKNNDPEKRGLNADFGMIDASHRANSMITNRQTQLAKD